MNEKILKEFDPPPNWVGSVMQSVGSCLCGGGLPALIRDKEDIYFACDKCGFAGISVPAGPGARWLAAIEWEECIERKQKKEMEEYTWLACEVRQPGKMRVPKGNKLNRYLPQIPPVLA